jgi:hypothetical protein
MNNVQRYNICNMSCCWNENWQEKLKCSEKTCPSATLSTTNPTWPDLGLNMGRRGGMLATNLLSYGTTLRKGWLARSLANSCRLVHPYRAPLYPRLRRKQLFLWSKTSLRGGGETRHNVTCNVKSWQWNTSGRARSPHQTLRLRCTEL